jgi:eukaryotic-like serine/threonine-protein kinase
MHNNCMSAAEHLVGLELKGRRSGRFWKVTEKIGFSQGLSQGHFSVAYSAVGDDGTTVFVKASDLGMFGRAGEDVLIALAAALNAHNFERQILDHCRGNNMDRVVTALDYGDFERSHHGTRDRIFFLIFEKARGDLRQHVTKQGAFSLLWAVTTLHNLFVAVAQLHAALVAHNDIKPGNALVFDDSIQKIADLGRATSSLFPVSHDAFQCAGDLRFAPPEQLYPHELNCADVPMPVRRVAGDIYNLGSLVHYVITARMMTPEIIPLLRPEHRPLNKSGGSHDSFQRALPYWRDAFSQMLMRLREGAGDRFGPGARTEIDRLVEITTQLCEPDPLLRGHPKNRGPSQAQYSLERYISTLDSIKSRLAIKAA